MVSNPPLVSNKSLTFVFAASVVYSTLADRLAWSPDGADPLFALWGFCQSSYWGRGTCFPASHVPFQAVLSPLFKSRREKRRSQFALQPLRAASRHISVSHPAPGPGKYPAEPRKRCLLYYITNRSPKTAAEYQCWPRDVLHAEYGERQFF